MKQIKAFIKLLCLIILMMAAGYTGTRLAQRESGNDFPQHFSCGESEGIAVEVLAQTVPVPAAIRRAFSMPDLFDMANPAVVAISTEIMGRNAFGQQVMRPSAGSGFLVTADGYIVTNHHVIENVSSITVLMYDGRTFPAEIVGQDAATDLAVIKIDVTGFQFLRFGNSDIVRVGEQVAAIGNPLGELANSMSVGHISALNRDIRIDGTEYNKIQTDAAINRGNSGGPLLNIFGEVIGVVSAKSTGMNVEGLGFAIPSSQAQAVTAHLIEYGFVRGRAVLGISVGTNLAGQVQIAIVHPNSAAEAAGLQTGDIILQMQTQLIQSFTDMRNVLDAATPGDEITLRIRRGREEITIRAILDELQPIQV
jgi:serine protease Do